MLAAVVGGAVLTAGTEIFGCGLDARAGRDSSADLCFFMCCDHTGRRRCARTEKCGVPSAKARIFTASREESTCRRQWFGTMVEMGFE